MLLLLNCECIFELDDACHGTSAFCNSWSLFAIFQYGVHRYNSMHWVTPRFSLNGVYTQMWTSVGQSNAEPSSSGLEDPQFGLKSTGSITVNNKTRKPPSPKSTDQSQALLVYLLKAHITTAGEQSPRTLDDIYRQSGVFKCFKLYSSSSQFL